MLLNAERGIILAYKPNYSKNEKVRKSLKFDFIDAK